MITYIILDKLSGLCKIGKTSNFKNRLSTLSTGNLNLHPLMFIEGDEERMLHRIFKDKKIQKEWYNLTVADIEGIEDFKFENIINNNYGL